MDRSWEYKDWEPAAGMPVFKWPEFSPKPKKKRVEALQEDLIQLTKSIKDLPYMYSYWSLRAFLLNLLGYPELAAADAYKAHMLITEAFKWSSSLGDKVRMTRALMLVSEMSDPRGLAMSTEPQWKEKLLPMFHRARAANYTVLIQSLLYLRALPDLFKICKEASELYPPVDSNGKHFAARYEDCFRIFDSVHRIYMELPWIQLKGVLYSGQFRSKIYPWMAEEYRVRSQSVVDAANVELRKASECLEVRTSTIGNGCKCFGMFATRDIREHETILAAKHPMSATIDYNNRCTNCYRVIGNRGPSHSPSFFACCPDFKYCGTQCKDIARQYYHQITCGKDFGAIIERAQNGWGGKHEKDLLSTLVGPGKWQDKIKTGYNSPLETTSMYPDQIPIFMVRALAICVQHGGHPLETPGISQLTAGPADEAPLTTFNLNGNVIGQIEILTKLGINVFEDHRYDSWVLQTIWHRMKNNAALGFDPRTNIPNWNVSPFYSWFNHSCEPNASVGPQVICSDDTMVSLQAIKAGEEVFVSYVGPDILLKSRAERCEILSYWLKDDCKCRRCNSDGDEIQNPRFLSYLKNQLRFMKLSSRH